ncbi:hypothetical protein HWQ17_22925 (plasmid) [Enterobacter pasteurii]|uniref:hypothetical protein n=1 Tax=Enterobacter pasteurii TaxID=3029761 RepID=UPI0011DE3316|nr:hypothetical protein [Enterobacter pasteurii]ELK6541663.1 hypothetical protein [Enterobacter bugandensis]QLA70494.1 hypothetical protein HWQ17_22925 [Enterobacter pasteurii]
MNMNVITITDCGGEAIPTSTPLVCALSVGVQRDIDIDQTTIINEQLALAAKQQKGLFFPSGKYRVDGNINISSSHSSLVGSRSGTTIFYNLMNEAPVVSFFDTTAEIGNIIISDIIFDNITINLRGLSKSNIIIRYNAFINSKSTDSTKAQIYVSHSPYIIKGNVLMRGVGYPGVGISTYKCVDTIISYNYLGSTSNQTKAQTYIDSRTSSLLTKLINAKKSGKITLGDDQGNYISAWYATDQLRDSKFFRNFIQGNTLQKLYNPTTQLNDIERDHIIYIKQYDNVEVYQNYFNGWPGDSHGQVKFRNAQNLTFVANYIDSASFDGRAYDNSTYMYMRYTYIFNNYIKEGKVTYWQNFTDTETKKIDVVDFLVFDNTFFANDLNIARITSTQRNISRNFFYTSTSNLYDGTTTHVVANKFTDITLSDIKNKVHHEKRKFLTMQYILPSS